MHASRSYGVDATPMSLQQHGWDIHALKGQYELVRAVLE
jgi:hypothetical protein